MNEIITAMPVEISLEKWADLGFSWQGVVPITQFERLADAIDSMGDETLEVALHLVKQDKVLWLSYVVSGKLPVSCQRCLESMTVDVSGKYRMAILENTTKISYLQALDETAEYVLVDEVCDTDARKMLPIADLLEDELLLAIPLSPVHDDCEMLTDSVGDIPDTPKENPFAMLEQLKGKL